MVVMYCVKGKHKVDVKSPQTVALPKGRGKVRMKAYKANCPKHGTAMYRIIGKA